MAKEQTITVPDIGNNKDVSIIEVLVKPGDVVKQEDSLITLESDKAAMEIPSSHAGTVKGVIVKVGDKVSQGSPILVLVEAEAEAGSAPAAEPEPVADIASANSTNRRSIRLALIEPRLAMVCDSSLISSSSMCRNSLAAWSSPRASIMIAAFSGPVRVLAVT